MAELSPEQREVVESWGKGLAVLAGAGSGKTTTLVTKCEELLKRWPEARFAAVSFTDRSAGDLREKLTLRIGPLQKHWVMTIHGLCGSVLREFPREAGFDGEESMLAESEAQLLWEEAMETLWFEELPRPAKDALDLLLSRESRDSLSDLLRRTRDLHLFGIHDSLGSSGEPGARALGEVHSFLLDRYQRLKRRRGALDFNDLEAGADRALEFSHVREQYQRKFDLVLVDEFQDTNPVQARIILRFVRPDASNLCVVGDPKQSIYRFRDADVSVFEEFCARLPENKSLTWNFRSRPGIIDYSNAVCAPAFESAGMAYEALVPQREPGPEEAVVRLDVSSPADLANWVNSERERGVALDQMALLLRRIRGNERWLKALVAAGIPIAIGSGGLFWEDPRVREMMSFLKWWANPSKIYSGAVFLRAPWMGVADRTLDGWIRQASVEKRPAFLRELFESSHPVANALAKFRECPARPGELLLSLLASPEIEAEIGAQLLGLWNRAEELSYRGLDFQEVVAELSKAMDEGRRERDVPPPRNLGQLAVLTLHSSKGLEFPHVLLVDFAPRARNSDTPLLFWDREKGAFLGGRDADGERVHRKDPVEKSWAELERKKNLAESMRLFYVALTRARERLVLVCPELRPEQLEKASYDPEKVFLKDDWRGWVECGGTSLPKRADLPSRTSPGERLTRTIMPSNGAPPVSNGKSILRRPRHSVTEWNLLSRCPRAYEWKFVRPPAEAPLSETSRDGFRQTGISRRELGTRVHACLERGDFRALLQLEQEFPESGFAAQSLIDWAESSPFMRASAPHGGFLVRAELAFEAPVGDEVFVGSMDRVLIETREGVPNRLSVVDFKVTSGPRGPERLLEAYRTQMLLYGEAALLLEPELQQEQVTLILVNIHPRGVQELEIPFDQRLATELASQASEIANGLAGVARPGSSCTFCEFKSVCSEARA
ncbi:MAG: hypothetical protein A2X94_08935 [Bdellovibrionales bacterium GWB1_55_8]|nr:MAG: hypothetical protein A2X94_08935 [Bdellovibrionales bacterium GWB1_55_8]